MQAFFDKLMKAAKDAGIEAAEAFLVERDHFNAMSTEGEITDYSSNRTRGLGFRGMKNGRMGYASTEAFDDDAIAQLVRGVVESAELCEDTDEEFLFDGEGEVPEMALSASDYDQITAEEKLSRVLAMEKAARAVDERVGTSAFNNAVSTTRGTVRIVNTNGLDRSYTITSAALFSMPAAKEGERVSSGDFGLMARSLSELDGEAIAKEAAKRAVAWLNAAPVETGKYRVVFHHEALTSLMQAFCGIFSAETAQKGLSLLKGKVGEQIAAPCVTLIDDPLMKDGLASRPFDDEGVPSKTNVLIENGVFKTFLHNLKTSHKDGVQTTGNAGRASYASSVRVMPSNLYFKPGEKSYDELLNEVGDGVVITDVSGLHAGANAVSGDFSLLSKGYVIKDGIQERTVEQITVAGNFYDLLKNAVAFANDLCFPSAGMGSPSLYAGEMSISGK